MNITTVLFVAALAVGTASAQASGGAGRDAFLKQQAVAEMQRVSAQAEVPELGTRESTVPPKSFGILPAKSPLFLEPKVGENLLVNSSFEMGLVGHRLFSETTYTNGSPVATTALVTETSVDGRQCLRVDIPEGVYRAVLIGTSPRVGAGARAVYSVSVKAEKPAKVMLSLFTATVDIFGDGSTDWEGTARQDRQVTTEWKRLELACRTTPRQAWVSPSIHFTSPGTYWVDAEQLEIKSEGGASPYRPAAPVEAAFELDETIFVQKDGDSPVRHARLMDYDSRTGRLAVKDYPFTTPKFGRFALEAKVEGRPAYPAEFAVVHKLKAYPGKGLFIGVNGGLQFNRPGSYKTRQYLNEKGSDGDYHRNLRLGGFKLLRLWDGGLSWVTLEPKKGEYNWQNLDYILDRTRTAGLDTMFVLGDNAFLKFIKNPKRDKAYQGWFVREHSRPAKIDGMPRWTSGLEIRDEDWTDFVQALVRHASGRIPYYEIVNEPNIQVADPEYYVHIQKLAYEIIRREAPKAKVVGICSTGDFGGDIGGYIGKVGAQGAFEYLDIMSFHPYSGPTDVTPKTAEQQLAEIRRVVDRYRPGCPIIEDELYYICNNSTEKEANRGLNWRASNVVRRYVLDFAGGCFASAPLHQGQLWRCGPEASGVNGRICEVTHGLHASELYIASNAFAHFLEGGRYLEKPAFGEGLNGGVFEDVRGLRVTVLWAKRETDVREIDVPAGTKAYDLFGNLLEGRRVKVTEDAIYLVKAGL